MKDRSLSIFSSLIIIISSFVFSLYFTRIASEELFKEYNLVLPLVMAFSQLILMGSPAGLTTVVLSDKYSSNENQDLVYNSFIIAIFTFSITLFFNYFFAKYLFKINSSQVLFITLSALGVAYRDALINYYQTILDFKNSAIFSLFVFVTSISALVGVFYFKLIYLIWILLIPLSIYFIFKVKTQRFTRVNTFLIKVLLKEGWYTAPFFFLLNFLNYLQRLIFIGKTDLLFFNSYALFSTLALSIFSNLLISLFRKDSIAISRSFQLNKFKDVNYLIKKTFTYVFFISIVATSTCFFLGKYFVEILFSYKYIKHSYLISFLIPLASINALISIQFLVLQTVGKLYLILIQNLSFPIFFTLFIFFLQAGKNVNENIAFITILAYLASIMVYYLISHFFLRKSIKTFYANFMIISLLLVSLTVFLCHK